jgi:maltooligosyltrehalose trehalohydrolase
MVIDPSLFSWSDADWQGIRGDDQVIYELHVGTFTREGTFAAAAAQLSALAELGITTIELMPIAEFEGRFGWGYDGVDLFAPSHLYGTPDDLRRLVDRAHQTGLSVILDVVYNHLGPVGNYLRAFSPAYFTDRYKNEWGDAINFDGDDAGPVREWIVANAGYWIDEFHFDGLRLDATQQIFDRSPRHILADVGAQVRDKARNRRTFVVAENERQEVQLVLPRGAGGFGLDALWNDDFHHSALVALTGRAEAYYSDTQGTPQELVSAAKYGFLFQGQHYAWQGAPRGTPALDLPPRSFVVYLQNHDQVANSARGLRGHQLSSPGRWRAMTALLLLWPGVPMIFQGQEFGASVPFLFFADLGPELAPAVRSGRHEFLAQFPSIAEYVKSATLDDPSAPATYERCKLDFSERETHHQIYALHHDLMHLRRDNAAFRLSERRAVDGAVLAPQAMMLRYFTEGHADDRVLIVNLGPDLVRHSIAEPLLAPPLDCEWIVQWTSEDPRYGGGGVGDLRREGAWRIPAEATVLLAPSVPAGRTAG